MNRAPTDVADLGTVTARLASWSRSHCGDGAEVTSVARLPGHSGISFSFSVDRPGAPVERFVVRLSPPGVRQSEGADVLRQVPVLDAAYDAGIPVPRVRDSSARDSGADVARFGTDYLVVDFVDGLTMRDCFDPEFADHAGGLDAGKVFADAVRVLAEIHAIDWPASLASWERPRTLESMIAALVPGLRRAEDPSWVDEGMRLRRRLLDTIPRTVELGLVHNDYYSNNWILGPGDDVRAVLDWETACVGPVGVDVGWLCMLYDPSSWADVRRRSMSWHPPGEQLLEWYGDARGEPLRDAAWYRAFAGFRLASGTSHYLRLHRRGRRVDAVWEQMAQSVPVMLDRAFEVLDRGE